MVDAVQCGVAVQKELQARNAELPENRKMPFRIGINLRDVIEEQDRIYGDDVNIAERIEGLFDEVLQLSPNFSVEDFVKAQPYYDEELRQFMAHALRKGGMK